MLRGCKKFDFHIIWLILANLMVKMQFEVLSNNLEWSKPPTGVHTSIQPEVDKFSITHPCSTSHSASSSIDSIIQHHKKNLSTANGPPCQRMRKKLKAMEVSDEDGNDLQCNQ